MLLAFGLTDSAFKALPRSEREEMWAWWQWRHEMKHQLEEKQRMEQGRGGVSM